MSHEKPLPTRADAMLTATQLAAYLRRIGYAEAVRPTLPVLASLAGAHARSIPFENLDAFVGRRVSLDPAAVFGKLVLRNRGGWCFEQNLLLGSALRAVGFEVTDLAGRVLWGRDLDAVTPRTHRTLRVRIADRDWLVDVGFGGQSMTGALDLGARGPQQIGNDVFRLDPLDGDDLLSVQIRGEWLPMYRFDLQPQWPVDFEAANFQLCIDPASHFTQGLALSLATVDGRHALRDGELKFHHRDGSTTRRELRDSDEVLAALRAEFGLQIDADLEQALRDRLRTAANG